LRRVSTRCDPKGRLKGVRQNAADRIGKGSAGADQHSSLVARIMSPSVPLSVLLATNPTHQ
jgi:hypothetical protein